MFEFSFDPSECALLLLYLSQECDEAEPPRTTCHEGHFLHKLHVENHYFGVKKLLTRRYQVDSETAGLCAAARDDDCPASQIAEEEGIGCCMSYWDEQKKTLTKRFCWSPSADEPDFNMRLEVEVSAHSAGVDEEELADLTGSAILLVHVAWSDA